MAMWYEARRSLARVLNFKIEHSQVRYFRALQQSVGAGRHWLDVGCGRQLLPDWAASPSRQQELTARTFLVGVDIDSGLHENRLVHQRVLGIGEQLPFRDGTFDLVTANMVIEHLEHPQEAFTEIWRVLRVGGTLLFHTPNLRCPLVRVASWVPGWIKGPIVRLLEGRHEKDIFKTHYRANTVQAILDLARCTNYQVTSLDVGGSVGALVRLGPFGVVEVFLLKLLSLPAFSPWNVTIIAVLIKAD